MADWKTVAKQGCDRPLLCQPPDYILIKWDNPEKLLEKWVGANFNGEGG